MTHERHEMDVQRGLMSRFIITQPAAPPSVHPRSITLVVLLSSLLSSLATTRSCSSYDLCSSLCVCLVAYMHAPVYLFFPVCLELGLLPLPPACPQSICTHSSTVQFPLPSSQTPPSPCIQTCGVGRDRLPSICMRRVRLALPSLLSRPPSQSPSLHRSRFVASTPLVAPVQLPRSVVCTYLPSPPICATFRTEYIDLNRPLH